MTTEPPSNGNGMWAAVGSLAAAIAAIFAYFKGGLAHGARMKRIEGKLENFGDRIDAIEQQRHDEALEEKILRRVHAATSGSMPGAATHSPES